MIRTLPTHGGPGYILFCLALASLLLYAHEWAKLREVGTQVQLSQSERPLFPVPEKEGVVRSGCNFTSSKERATLKSPSGRRKPIFVARCRGVEDACGGGGSLWPSHHPSALSSSHGAESRGAACLCPFSSCKGGRVGADTPFLGCCLTLTCLEFTSVSLLVLYLLKAISQTVPKEGSSQNNFSPMETQGGAVSCHWAPPQEGHRGCEETSQKTNLMSSWALHRAEWITGNV